MQTFKSVYLKVYIVFIAVSAAYSLEEVMNTHRLGWLGVALTSWPIAAFFIRLFTDSIPRTKNKLIPIHILGFIGLVVTVLSEPNHVQIVFAVMGVMGLLAYDFWYSKVDYATNADLQDP